ncbi:hypothetical protein KC340_g105 [Hortaea werneckii]|nr:hypothetical protein KC340_g105 [Hortaea werneckii]
MPATKKFVKSATTMNRTPTRAREARRTGSNNALTKISGSLRSVGVSPTLIIQNMAAMQRMYRRRRVVVQLQYRSHGYFPAVQRVASFSCDCTASRRSSCATARHLRTTMLGSCDNRIHEIPPSYGLSSLSKRSGYLKGGSNCMKLTHHALSSAKSVGADSYGVGLGRLSVASPGAVGEVVIAFDTRGRSPKFQRTGRRQHHHLRRKCGRLVNSTILIACVRHGPMVLYGLASHRYSGR